MMQAVEVRRVAQTVFLTMAIGCLLLPSDSARSQEKDPHEMTSQGVISEHVREMYAKEIEACYQQAGQAARGPQFLDCVKRRARQQEDALTAVFSARMSYLEASPELAGTLQKAQTAWVQFRDANCAYIQSIARPSYADEAFQNCLLRTTIYRRVHLRWSVGDLDVHP
jgi:uncharacterized protein YecT (DUF1311 family)